MHSYRLFTGLTGLALLVGLSPAVTRYVATTGSDTFGDGTSGNPYATIQKGINESAMSGDVVELADGTYVGFGNVGVNYVGKAVIVRSTSGSPQACIVDGMGTIVGFQFISNEPAGAVLEGITVRNCLQQGIPDGEGRGGAIVIENANPTIQNCIFTGNMAVGGEGFLGIFPVNGLGGAIYAFNCGSTFTNCSFVGNTAIGGNSFLIGYAGIGGGGAVAGQNANLRFVGCSFGNNTTTGGADGFLPPAARGGAVYIDSGSAIFEGCMFTQNASGVGGASFVYNGSAEAVNCLFVKNTATENGAGMAASSAGITVLNCSFAGNEATQNGGAIHVDGGFGPNSVGNSILWDNTALLGGSGFFSTGGAPSTAFAFSVVQSSGGSASWSLSGAADAGSNLDANPGFLRTPGTLSLSDLGDLRLSSTSICIDSGSNALVPLTVTADIDGEDRIFMGVVDRGAYEFHVSPAQLINDLKASIDALVAGGASLPAQGRGLKATLNLALVAVNNGNNNVAVLALRAFQLQAWALGLARRLTPAQANALIADAEGIIDLIN